MAPDTNVDARDDQVTLSSTGSVVIDVLLNDVGPDRSKFEVRIVQAPAGTAEVLPDGTIRFAPAAGSNTDSFTYELSDGVSTDIATVRIEAGPTPPMEIPETPAAVLLSICAGGWLALAGHRHRAAHRR